MSGRLTTFAEYAAAALRTRLPSTMEPPGVYPALGLVSEVGELLYAEAWLTKRDRLLDEAGDLLWYVAMWAHDRAPKFTKPFAGGAPLLVVELEEIRRHLAIGAGEIAALEKRALRDGQKPDPVVCYRLADELLNVLANFLYAYGLSLQDAAERNIAKLAGRAERGTIGGAGER